MKQTIIILCIILFSIQFLASEDILYTEKLNTQVALVQHIGLYTSLDGGLVWNNRTSGLPQRSVYPEYSGGVKTFSCIAIGASVNNQPVILAATPSRIYKSVDGGLNWGNVPMVKPMKPTDYITAIAGHPYDPDRIIIGTSYSGIFETKDSGKSWKRFSDILKKLYRGAGFYEEIMHLDYKTQAVENNSGNTDSDRESILLSTGYTKESYNLKNGKLESTPYSSAAHASAQSIQNLKLQFPDTNTQLEKYVETKSISGNTENPVYLNRRGIYLNSFQAGSNKIDAHLDFLAAKGLNSIVVDFKDDNGVVTFDTKYEFPKKIGAVRERIKLDTLVEKVHSRGAYLIARIVVFKDKQLYKQPGYAIMDTNGSTWGHKFKVEKEEETIWEQREFWVDPFNANVWEYNTLLAKELQERGVDEIQFDYIRFPSDGDTSRAVYTAKKEGMTRIEALESFLIRVREDIHIPISTDLYGFNSWYRMGNWIGQSLELLAEYVDVICPMFYPSHFPSEFLKGLEYKARAERIYHEGSNRAAAIVGNKAVIRPYVQAFLLPFEYYMEEPEYTEYLRLQVKGTEESNASGFLLWNNSNRYYMVTDNIDEYTVKAKSESDVLD